MNKHAYTIQEAAETLSLSPATVEGLIRRGDLETVNFGRARRITHRQLDAFLQRAEKGDQILGREQRPG